MYEPISLPFTIWYLRSVSGDQEKVCTWQSAYWATIRMDYGARSRIATSRPRWKSLSKIAALSASCTNLLTANLVTSGGTLFR